MLFRKRLRYVGAEVCPVGFELSRAMWVERTRRERERERARAREIGRVNLFLGETFLCETAVAGVWLLEGTSTTTRLHRLSRERSTGPVDDRARLAHRYSAARARARIPFRCRQTGTCPRDREPRVL